MSRFNFGNQFLYVNLEIVSYMCTVDSKRLVLVMTSLVSGDLRHFATNITYVVPKIITA